MVLDYWYGIPEVLRANGAQVYVATVPSFNSDEERALALQAYVHAVKLESGADKVNLIGHSQGGPTSRMLAAMSPQDVASVTTIGSPHRGSEVADTVLDLINGLTSSSSSAFGCRLTAERTRIPTALRDALRSHFGGFLLRRAA
ncbi:lipase [Cupriavidus necator N-1]|uniref:Lipase n=1 Tax=Cupriavidus necator (strain ATCC 43291 / DSM 13513 / CCUG 52238 / LMG 8453 / N-1) TaxID=1042878 RepID=G0ES41_CUPNN|nr:lipase [Cupriavidus necator N-1]